LSGALRRINGKEALAPPFSSLRSGLACVALAVALAASSAKAATADCETRNALEDMRGHLGHGVLLIRHGDTEKIGNYWVLTPSGQAQARALGEALGRALEQTSVTLYHSDRQRAAETALGIAKAIEATSSLKVTLVAQDKLSPTALQRFLRTQVARRDILIYVEHSETINPLIEAFPSTRCAEALLFQSASDAPGCVMRFETPIPSTNPACSPH
jgi:phosphohistidine phosphatase SixA